MALRERLKSSTVACSNVIDAANSLMTKTGVAVNAIFVLTIGYDVIYYMFGTIGVVFYMLSSPLQKIGMLLSAFNSVANPFVYVLLMPDFGAVVEGSNTGSDTATGGNEPATIDTSCQAKPETPSASPKHVQVEMTPVPHTA